MRYWTRQNQAGTTFAFWIADAVGEQWYNPSGLPQISEGEARSVFHIGPSERIEWDELAALHEFVEDGDTVLECGPHHGLMTVLLGAWVGTNGRVLACEADLDNAGIVQRNVNMNGLDNISICQAAIGGESGLAQLYNPSNRIAKKAQAVEGVIAPMLTLDQANPFGSVDLVKLDIEGMELAALQSGCRTLKTAKRFAVEVHTDLIGYESACELVELFKDWETRLLCEDGWRTADQVPETRFHLFACK